MRVDSSGESGFELRVDSKKQNGDFMQEKEATANVGMVQGSAKEFVAYYQSEIQHQVNRIRDLIHQMRKEPQNRPLLDEICQSSRSISDLAMVYGFEGVEVIADRIERAVEKLAGKEASKEFLTRLEEATGAIEKAMILIDERRERQIIRELSQQAFDSDSFSYVEPAGEEYPDEAKIQDDDFNFDIKEDEKLISILSDVDDEPYEIENKPIPQSNEEKPAPAPDFEPVDSSELNFDFEVAEEGEFPAEKPTVEEDVLEIDFHRADQDSEKEKGGFFHKIGRLFGGKSEKKEVLEHS